MGNKIIVENDSPINQWAKKWKRVVAFACILFLVFMLILYTGLTVQKHDDLVDEYNKFKDKVANNCQCGHGVFTVPAIVASSPSFGDGVVLNE